MDGSCPGAAGCVICQPMPKPAPLWRLACPPISATASRRGVSQTPCRSCGRDCGVREAECSGGYFCKGAKEKEEVQTAPRVLPAPWIRFVTSSRGKGEEGTKGEVGRKNTPFCDTADYPGHTFCGSALSVSIRVVLQESGGFSEALQPICHLQGEPLQGLLARCQRVIRMVRLGGSVRFELGPRTSPPLAANVSSNPRRQVL